jgi:CO dehydrogenase/acetyl-CoA synthase alpha subunit
MIDNASLVMFCYNAIREDNVCYMNEFDAVVVADFEQDTLYLKDVFCETEVPLDKIISAMASKETRKVVLGFTPNDKATVSCFIACSLGLQRSFCKLFV